MVVGDHKLDQRPLHHTNIDATVIEVIGVVLGVSWVSSIRTPKVDEAWWYVFLSSRRRTRQPKVVCPGCLCFSVFWMLECHAVCFGYFRHTCGIFQWRWYIFWRLTTAVLYREKTTCRFCPGLSYRSYSRKQNDMSCSSLNWNLNPRLGAMVIGPYLAVNPIAFNLWGK